MTTLKAAKIIARELGYSVNKTDCGEYRYAPLQGTPAERELAAGYASDVDDALGSIRADVARQDHIERDFNDPVHDGGPAAFVPLRDKCRVCGHVLSVRRECSFCASVRQDRINWEFER